MSIEIAEGRVWIYETRHFEGPPRNPLYVGLQWILEQINFGNTTVQTDHEGGAVSLTIGRSAAPPADSVSVEEAIEHEQKRTFALDIARILATARERGIEPRHWKTAETLRNTATEAAYRTTDLYYAFEMVALLRRASERTFLLDAPPILGRAPADTVEALGEATRCFLLGFVRPCLSLCRLALETVLRSKVPKHDLLQEVWRSKTGELESLINVAASRSILSPDLRSAAHSVRRAGNDAVHGPSPKDEDVWELLIRMRQIVEYVCSPKTG